MKQAARPDKLSPKLCSFIYREYSPLCFIQYKMNTTYILFNTKRYLSSTKMLVLRYVIGIHQYNLTYLWLIQWQDF